MPVSPQTQSRKARAERPAAAPLPDFSKHENPQQAWDDYFRSQHPDLRAIGDAVGRMHEAGQTDQIIACLEAALINGQAQPWMYTVLALEMEKAGKPREEIERVLLSTVDFSAVNVQNLLHSAAYLVRFGAKQKGLELYRQASNVDPARLEPYLHGLRIAREADDPATLGWAATGILTRAWSKNYESLHREAEAIVRDFEKSLRSKGRNDEADALSQQLAAALVRDMVVELQWSGKADLDLLVEEPGGATCSINQPATGGGGVFVHDGMGGTPQDSFDKYVCPQGQPGAYRAIVRYVSGDVVGKRALLRIVRYQGTPYQVEERIAVPLGENDKSIRISLHRGRLHEVSAAPPLLESAPTISERARGVGRPETVTVRRTPFARQAAPGFQPVISIISEGVALNSLAVVSGDRRYVRLSLQPVFSAITGVNTFSFINSGNANQRP